MAANLDTTAHLRYMATVRRQSAPPRCHPFLIVVLVLAFGMIFIGATMSLIAHWPGSTQIGENPLKVVGPLILAVGIIGVIVGIVLVCILNSRERKRFQKQMTTAIISRSMENLNDESQMRRDTSAVATYPEGAQSYRYAVEDSSAGPAAVVSDKSAAAVNEADNIPMPVRVPKPRRQKDTSAEVDMSSTEDLTAAGGGSEDAGKAGTEENVPRKKRRRPKPTAGSEEEGAALMSAAEPLTDSAAVQPSPGETRRLKVHIKAQPGAAVHIQNAPPVAPKPAYRPPKAHNTSTETDI